MTTAPAFASLSRLAIICAIGATFAFSTNDMLVKVLSGGYPLHQIVFVRSIIGVVLIAFLIAPLEGAPASLRTTRLRVHLVRALFVVLANLTFFTALAALPLAEATAIFFIAPLLITGLSVLLLGETVGPRRWAAVVVGFIGVFTVVRPGAESFQVAALLPLLAAGFYAGLHILTRKLGLAERASTMALYIQVVFLFVSGGFGLIAGDGAFATFEHPSLQFLFAAWIWPSPWDMAVIGLVGLLSGGGAYMITQAYRQGEAALIAPFEYLSLVLSIAWGYVIWGDTPDIVAGAGMALILGSGVYLAFREARVAKRPSVTPDVGGAAGRR
ncbi:MAG: DMT family transporter [Pseudomonadota bacterium]